MLSVRLRSSAVSQAKSPLLLSCWKGLDRQERPQSLAAPNLLYSDIRVARNSTIADAMLGRAVNNYQPPPSQRDAQVAAKVAALKPTSSPLESQKGIDDMMKEAPSKNKGSISGWTNSCSINKVAPRPFAHTTSSSGYEALPGTYAVPKQANDLKRSYDEVDQKDALAARIAASKRTAMEKRVAMERARSLNAIAPKAVSSFGNSAAVKPGASTQNAMDLESNIVDLTQDEAPRKSHVPASVVELNWDLDDFENDSEIDLDMEYALPLPKAAPTAPSQPLQSVSMNKSMPNAAPPGSSMMPPKTPNPKFTSQGFPIPSSAPEWSSSPQSHYYPAQAPPPRMQSIQESSNPPPMSSEASIDANPRGPKRRNLPWDQAQQAAAQKSAKSGLDAAMKCFKCQRTDHFVADCPQDSKTHRLTNASSENGVNHIRAHAYSPLPTGEGKDLPWETKASTIKDNEKEFKNQQKAKKGKIHKADMDNMFSVAKQHNDEKIISRKPEKSSRVKPGEIYLSDEQQKVLLLVTKEKRSVFFTGSAGTGKSVLMRAIIADLQKTYKRTPENIAVTASTGLAACNIGGVTLHSFSGVGLGKESVPDLVKKIMRNQKAKKRWLNCKVLVIDEISMVDGDFFDKLEGIARIVRKNARPFGGIQLVVTGDFFQLPPVPDYGNRNVKFAFDADTWQTSIHHTIGLTEVFRQRDPMFANMLNEMRLGKLSAKTLEAFRKLDRPLPLDDKISATELFPTRNEVENANFMKLRNLPGTGKVYMAEDGGTVKDKQQLDRLLQNFMAPKMLELKKGSQVMLIKNMDENLVNGSLGRVTRFATEDQFNLYCDGKLDELYDSDDESSQNALSREARNQIKTMSAGGAGGPKPIATTQKRFPVVAFLLADGTERELLLQPEDWKVELPNGEIQAQRRQLPLILAWALSIHKAQGQTLERVKVDLRRVFENGQAYVALSRATTQEGLWVQNFNEKAVMAHPRVAQFYDSLYSVNKALKHPKVKAKPKETGECPPDLEMEMLHAQGGNEWDEDEEMMLMYGN